MYTTQIKVGRWLSLLGYFSLMAGLYSWHLLGPLLFPLRGLLNGKLYTHAWSMYMAIYYFIVGVWYGAGADSLLFGIYVVSTSLLFFAGTALFTRYSGKAMNQNAHGRE